MEPTKLASSGSTYSHIDMDERRKIERWHAAKISVDEIANKLGRHRSTIFRELKRNRFDDAEMPKLCGYYCVTAKQRATRRRYNLRKLIRLPKLRDAIIERIKHGWSLQQIAGRLKLERGFDRGPVMYACHETEPHRHNRTATSSCLRIQMYAIFEHPCINKQADDTAGCCTRDSLASQPAATTGPTPGMAITRGPVKMIGHEIVEAVIIEPLQSISAVWLRPYPYLKRWFDFAKLFLGGICCFRIQYTPLTHGISNRVEDLCYAGVERILQQQSGMAAMCTPP